MADLPMNTQYSTGGATATPKASMANILGWKKPAAPAPTMASAPVATSPNVLGAYKPVSQDVKDYLSSGGTSFLPETPVGAPAIEKISPIPEGYSPFRTPGEFTNPASAVVPEQPMIQQFPQGGQMNIDVARPGTLNKSERAYLGGNQNASILGTLSPKMFQVDHIIPLWAGGADTIANKQILPNPIHNAKTKIQSVAQTLLDHGEIDLGQARVMALNWQHRKASGIPDVNEYGEIPIDTARAIAKEWEKFDAGKGSVSVGDVVRGIPGAALNLGKGVLPEWSRQFLVGALSGLTAGGIPLESAPGADIKDKAAGLVGEAIGMFYGIGKFAKLTKLAESVLFAKKAAAPITIAKSDTLGGASIFDLIQKPSGEVLGNVAKGLGRYSPKNVINTIRGNMSREIVGKMARNAAIFAEYGQAGQTISDFTQPQQDAINAHISRLGMDLALGGIVGAFPGTWKGAGKVGFGTMVLGLMAGENTQQALAQGVAMAGLHKVGGFAKDTSKAQKENEIIVDDSATKGSLALLHGILGDKMGLKRIDPSAPAPKYDPAMINEWEVAGRAEIERLDREGVLRPFTGVGGPPGDKFILESNLKTAIGWLRTRELPIEQQDRSYVQGLSSVARYAKDRNELNGVNVPTSLEPFVGKLKERAPEMITERPAQSYINERWVMDGTSNLGEGNPIYQGVTGEVRLTGQKANAANKEQLDNFLQHLRDGNASPYVIATNQPELGIHFRESNRGLTPDRIKAGEKEIDPDNYIGIWGIVKDPKTGVEGLVPTGVKVPTKERIGVVTKGPNGERIVEGNEYAFNKDLDIATGKWPEENPNFNNKTLGTYVRARGTPTFVMRIKAFKGKEDPNPYLIAEVGDKEWTMTQKLWGELGPPSNYATYEENISRALASKNTSAAQPLLLKAAEQRAEMGDNASTVVKNESFVGTNEPRQGALFEMSDKANKVLVNAKTPEEVKAGFDQELGVQLTPEEASSVSSKRGTMTGGDLITTVGKAVEEGRSTPLTAGSYFTYIKPLNSSRVFKSSESGLLFDKMPILSKSEGQQAMAGRLSAASGEKPSSPKERLLEQEPITKASPAEAPSSPEYQKAVEDLQMVGLGTGRQYAPQGLDSYADALIKKIEGSKVSPEEKKALGTEALKLINRDDLQARSVSWGSDEAWMKGVGTERPELVPEGASGFDTRFVNSIRDRIKGATGAEDPVRTGMTREELAEARIKNVPEMTKKYGGEFLDQVQSGIETLPKDSYGYAFYKTYGDGLERALAHGKKPLEANYDLQRFLSWSNSVGRSYWGKLFETIDERTGLPISQPAARMNKMARGAHGKELYEESAARTKELAEEAPREGTPESIGAAETGGLSPSMAEALPEWMQKQTEAIPFEQGVRVSSPTQAGRSQSANLTRMEAQVTPGRIALEGGLDREGKPLPKISEVEAGIEDGKRLLQDMMREYNKYIGAAREGGKRTEVKMRFISDAEWKSITDPIKNTVEIPRLIARAEEEIAGLQPLTEIGGTKARTAAAEGIAKNKARIDTLTKFIEKAKKASSKTPVPAGQGGPGFDQNSPAMIFANLGAGKIPQAQMNAPNPIVMGPTTFTSTIKPPEELKLNQVDTAKPLQTLSDSWKTLNAPPKVRKAKPAGLPPLDPLLSSPTTGLTQGGSSLNVPARGQAYYMGKNGKGFPQTSHPVIAGVDFSEYAENPRHVEAVKQIMSELPPMANAQDYQAYINRRAPRSPVTGQMIENAVAWNQLNPEETRLLIAEMVQDSALGTAGAAVKTRSPGNVGNTGGQTREYIDWQTGVNAVSNYIAQHREVQRTIPKTTDPSHYIVRNIR